MECGKLFLHTGCVMLRKRLRGSNPELRTEEEVTQSINDALVHFKESLTKEEEENLKQQETIHARYEELVKPVLPEDRPILQLSVKVFLSDHNVNSIGEVLKELHRELAVTTIDSILISFPADMSDDEPVTDSGFPAADMDAVKKVWRQMETYAGRGQIINMGVCDFSTNDLEALFDWSQVKPVSNQVNMQSCCVLPPEMTLFAKEHDIQLLTHHDNKSLYSSERLNAAWNDVFEGSESGWILQWALRYVLVHKHRGVIQNKGYILGATCRRPTPQQASKRQAAA